MHDRCFLGLIFLLSLCLGGPTMAAYSWMTDTKPVLAPSGYRDFCARAGAHCDAADEAAQSVYISSRSMRVLEKYNQKFNKHISYRSDMDLYGRSDYWTVATATGDCEDIALAKRAALIGAGWPPAALWLAIGRDSEGQAHVVLILRADKGDLVLDNRTDRITLWHHAPLRWIARQVPGDSRYWRLVDTLP